MQIADEIHEQVKNTPLEMVEEVLNFIKFLE